MSHLFNCHGEWFLLLSSVPFVGIAIAYIKHTARTHLGLENADDQDHVRQG